MLFVFSTGYDQKSTVNRDFCDVLDRGSLEDIAQLMECTGPKPEVIVNFLELYVRYMDCVLIIVKLCLPACLLTVSIDILFTLFSCLTQFWL